MPIRVSCACGATLNAPDAAAGKKVKCPKCAEAVPVPAADEGFEVVDDAPVAAKKPVVAKALPLPAKKAAPVIAEAVAPPKPKYKPREVDDDEDDDFDDDRPRKKAAKKGKKKGPPVLLLAAGGGVLFLIVAVVAGVLLFGGNGAAVPGVGAIVAAAGDAPPAGFSALRDDKAGYRVFVPGQVQVIDFEEALRRGNPANAEQMRAAPFTYNTISSGAFGGRGSVQVGGRATFYKDFKPGNTRPMLMDELKKVAITYDAKWNFPAEIAEVKLDGRPALIVRVKKNELWMQHGAGEGHADVMKDAPKDFQDRAKQQDADWNKRQAEQAAGRAGQTVHYIYIVTATDTAGVVIGLQTAGQYVDDATLKVVTDSFKFL